MTTCRRDFCQSLLARHGRSTSVASATLDELLAAQYAVVVQRDRERWLVAAADKQALADIELECLVATDGYDEWVAEVWCVEGFRRVFYSPHVMVSIGDVVAETTLGNR
jgi:hypothetical protein